MRFFQRYKTSLSTRLLIQTLVIGLTLVVILWVSISQVMSNQVQKEISKRADTLMHSVQIMIEISIHTKALEEAVEKLGGEDDVQSISIVGGDPLIVLASTHSDWLHRKLSEVAPEDMQADIVKTITLGESVAQHYHGNEFESTLPIIIASEKIRMQGAVHLILDISRIKTGIYKNVYEAMILPGTGMLLLIFCIYMSFRRNIFGPLAHIQDAIRRQSLGEQDAQAVILHDDEIGQVAASFNAMVGELAHIQGKIVNYAQDMELKNLDLSVTKSAAENVARLKSDFLAMMSHEIRTPMNGIIGMTELLLESRLDARQERYAKTVMNSADTLLTILNDILDLSKIEAGRLELESVAFDFQTMVEEICNLFSFRAKEKETRLEKTWDSSMPRYFLGDVGRIRQIVSNLFSNAIKFTNGGYVRLTAHVVSEGGGEVTLRVTVEDSGIGIPADVLPMIFDKFTQADASTTRKFGGTGLGLAICKQLTSLMSGDIGVESVLGKGTVFWFTVRLRTAEASDVAKAEDSRTEALESRKSLRGTRILLAEDNAVNQDLEIEMLETMECIVTLAQTGIEAVNLYDPDAYDIILMDCEMPDMDGYEATIKIREQEQSTGGKRIPIIALTANVLSGAREKCFFSGMDAHLSKPVSRKSLLMTLSKWLPGEMEDATDFSLSAVPQEKEEGISEVSLNEIRDLMREKYPAILRKFISNTDDLLSRLDAAISQKDNLQEVAREVHSLKSSSRYMGAVKVGNAAEMLEEAIQTCSDAAHLPVLLKGLKSSWQESRVFYEEDLRKQKM
jgi:signal transduction histidine kinase/CheY-like chemotaxis protein/HPt (histidine-containing phosphotransfer) domain-containing protein